MYAIVVIPIKAIPKTSMLTGVYRLMLVIVFLINGFHFAMDQLLNLSTDEIIKFIHWYVWISYVCILFTETAWNLAL